jgi:hypothetical protein
MFWFQQNFVASSCRGVSNSRRHPGLQTDCVFASNVGVRPFCRRRCFELYNRSHFIICLNPIFTHGRKSETLRHSNLSANHFLVSTKPQGSCRVSNSRRHPRSPDRLCVCFECWCSSFLSQTLF